VKRLRVAVVTDALYPWHKGGKEIRYLHLVRGLSEQNADVVVYSMKWWENTPEVVSTPSGSLTYVAICPRLPMYRGARRSITQAVIFALSTLRLLTRKFDVIEADHMPYMQLVPLRIVAWIKRAPLVITWHEVWGEEGWRSYLGRLGVAGAFVERVCIRLPDEIVAVSPGTEAKLVAMGARQDHVRVILSPLDFDGLFSTEADPASPELLFVGRLIAHKHADLAIDATQLLAERGHDVRLGIVGVGPEESRLRARAVDLGIDARVTFYSTIESQQDLWSLIRGSRVMLAPSVREGFGLIVAESLALGTPVVCALHPDNESSYLVGPLTGSLIEPFSAEALAGATEYWLNDKSSHADRVAAFMAEHAELTESSMSASYEEILRSVT
jgi:glycosyltransferase involved in cell wall biosynthesis